MQQMWSCSSSFLSVLCDPNALWCVDCCKLKGFTQYRREGCWGGQECIPAHDRARDLSSKKEKRFIFTVHKTWEAHWTWTVDFTQQGASLYILATDVCKDPQWFQYVLLTKGSCIVTRKWFFAYRVSNILNYEYNSLFFHVFFHFLQITLQSRLDSCLRKVIHHSDHHVCLYCSLSKVHYHCYYNYTINIAQLTLGV